MREASVPTRDAPSTKCVDAGDAFAPHDADHAPAGATTTRDGP